MGKLTATEMGNRTFLLVTRQSSSSSLLLLLALPLRSSPPSIFSSLSLSRPPHLRPPSLTCGCRRHRDSNADPFRYNFNSSSKRRAGAKIDYDDDAASSLEQLLDLLEEFIDDIIVFKALKSFGWFSPVIIISWLAATGPKAFLMAFTLVLGQSAVFFILQKLSGKTNSTRRRNIKNKKKKRIHTGRMATYAKEEESLGNKRRDKNYQSWVAGNNVPVDKDGRSSYSFGGWDELDKQTEIGMRSDNSPQRSSGPSRRQSTEKNKISREDIKNETPLLLRLLVAFFPFLSSWMQML